MSEFYKPVRGENSPEAQEVRIKEICTQLTAFLANSEVFKRRNLLSAESLDAMQDCVNLIFESLEHVDESGRRKIFKHFNKLKAEARKKGFRIKPDTPVIMLEVALKQQCDPEDYSKDSWAGYNKAMENRLNPIKPSAKK